MTTNHASWDINNVDSVITNNTLFSLSLHMIIRACATNYNVIQNITQIGTTLREIITSSTQTIAYKIMHTYIHTLSLTFMLIPMLICIHTRTNNQHWKGNQNQCCPLLHTRQPECSNQSCIQIQSTQSPTPSSTLLLPPSLLLFPLYYGRERKKQRAVDDR